MRRTNTIIMAVLGIMAIVPNVRAEIASKAYVDERDNTIIYGSTTPAAADVSAITNAGGVKAYVDASAYDDTALSGRVDSLEDDIEDMSGYGNRLDAAENAIGNINNATGEAISAVQSFAGVGNSSSVLAVNDASGEVDVLMRLGLGSLKLPTPPAACETKGCMLMYYNQHYVWEPVTRDANETISTTGQVDGDSEVDHAVETVGNPNPNFHVAGEECGLDDDYNPQYWTRVNGQLQCI